MRPQDNDFLTASATPGGAPSFKLPALPYAQNALEPHVSARTMGFHYGKHHQGYVDNLNKLVEGTAFADLPIDKILMKTAGASDKVAVFNNGAQAWNHAFFWRSMKKGGGGEPTEKLLKMIKTSFGSFDTFKEAFTAAAVSQFGSGWVWLVQKGDALEVVKTSNAGTPMTEGKTALLTCDVWEHAYYLDYQNRRKDFVNVFLDHLVDWEFASSRLEEND